MTRWLGFGINRTTRTSTGVWCGGVVPWCGKAVRPRLPVFAPGNILPDQRCEVALYASLVPAQLQGHSCNLVSARSKVGEGLEHRRPILPALAGRRDFRADHQPVVVTGQVHREGVGR